MYFLEYMFSACKIENTLILHLALISLSIFILVHVHFVRQYTSL